MPPPGNREKALDTHLLTETSSIFNKILKHRLKRVHTSRFPNLLSATGIIFESNNKSLLFFKGGGGKAFINKSTHYAKSIQI